VATVALLLVEKHPFLAVVKPLWALLEFAVKLKLPLKG
jgi:hypothetical protein